MSILKTIEKEKVKFLMDFDYNNVLGRLKFVLGKDASFFADIRVRQNDVTWSTKDNCEYKSLGEATEDEKCAIKMLAGKQIERIKNGISGDSLIGEYALQITTYPSNQFVYYTQINGEFRIVLTGWGCEDKVVQSMEHKDRQDACLSGNQPMEKQVDCSFSETVMGNTEHEAPHILKSEQKKVTDGIIINDHKKKKLNKEEKKYSKIDILKSVILILLAVFITLIIPVFLTGTVNRFVADVTGQWYLNGLSRILITIFIAIATYSVAYMLIRFTIFRKSIVFNIVCFILTFMWSVLMGIAWIPD